MKNIDLQSVTSSYLLVTAHLPANAETQRRFLHDTTANIWTAMKP